MAKKIKTGHGVFQDIHDSRGDVALPSFVLVVARASMDDLVLAAFNRIRDALKYIGTGKGSTNLGRDLRAAADKMNIDTSGWNCIALLKVSFGRVQSLETIRPITDAEWKMANKTVFKERGKVKAKTPTQR